MNAIEFFNLHRPMIEAAIVATWRQGRKSAVSRTGFGDTCLYLKGNGDRCAIGQMEGPEFWRRVPKNDAYAAVGGLPFWVKERLFPGISTLQPPVHADFLDLMGQVQRAHDDATSDFKADFADRIAEVYLTNGLGKSPLEGITE